jgi:hypothetical protein
MGIGAERNERDPRPPDRCVSRAPNRQSEPTPAERHQVIERARRDTRIGPAIDRSLIDRARTGDLEAFETIVRARMDAVYRLTSAILGHEADARDAAQETFVAAWRELPRLRDPTPTPTPVGTPTSAAGLRAKVVGLSGG